jgi:hypothetical protein
MGGARQLGRRARPLVVAAVVVILVVSALSRGLVGYADPTAATDDRSVAVAVSEWSYTGLSSAAVLTNLSTNKARLTRIVADPSSSPTTFTVSMVKNTGAYSVKTWSWDHDVTGAQLDADIAAASGRLIFADAYDTPSGERFAAVWVANTGAQSRSWWWVRDDTNGANIASQLTAHNARLQAHQPRTQSVRRVRLRHGAVGGRDLVVDDECLLDVPADHREANARAAHRRVVVPCRLVHGLRGHFARQHQP